MESFLVTGGAGFIGSHIARALVERGARVTILDNLSTGKAENVAPIASSVAFVRGDLRDPAAVAEALAKGADAVFHEAAVPSVVRSFEDPVETFSVALNGTSILLEECRRRGVRRVVFASSSAVYGDSPELPKTEAMAPAPKSPYALSKLSVEHLLRIWAAEHGLETVSLRYFNIFGARQDPASDYAAVIPRFITAALGGTPPTVYGDGLQTRDFCHVADVVRANLLCLEADGLAGRALNVAGGSAVTLLELVEKIGAAAGGMPAPRFAPPRPGDIRHSVASIDAARAAIGFSPAVGLEEGLAMTVRAFREGSAR